MTDVNRDLAVTVFGIHVAQIVVPHLGILHELVAWSVLIQGSRWGNIANNADSLSSFSALFNSKFMTDCCDRSRALMALGIINL